MESNEKNEFFDIDTAWGKLNCVAYTNTGISFEKSNHFDIVVGITNIATSVSVKAFIQMMFRIRNREKRIISLFYQKNSNDPFLPSGHGNIRTELAVAQPTAIFDAVTISRNLTPEEAEFFKLNSECSVADIMSLLKASKNFSSYNFRDYFYRHTRDSFSKNKFETRPYKILEFIKKSKDELATLKRQSYLSSLYSNGEKLIIERNDNGNKLLKDVPHIPHTGHLNLTKSANASCTPDLEIDKKSSQSHTCTSSSNSQESSSLKEDQQQANKKDHRAIGKSQQLFLVHPWSPGSIFMLPHGTRVFHKLQSYIRLKYKEYGFEEVMTPMIFKKDLWEMSGHWQNYQSDMFTVHEKSIPTQNDHHHNDSDSNVKPKSDNVFGLKPMNCPGHCLIFDNSSKSYRDLPLRLADFGSLHRNEASGVLTGLTRVRQFHQDDAHIFCRESQIYEEISSTLSFLENVYNDFKFPHYEMVLSTRHESTYIGELSEWDIAEESLKKALNQTGRKWTLNPGDAAFYGPKIDIMVKDAHHRMHQTATIQLDFQLPKRFKLKYRDENGSDKTPIIIHRAILGSIERMMAILIEHTGGKWPFWLSPRQAIIIPIGGTKSMDYANQVKQSLSNSKRHFQYFIDIDNSDNSLSKMIKTAQLAQYNFILVVGEKEQATQTVNVRQRDESSIENMTIEQLLSHFDCLTENYLLINKCS
ncbi:13122_t:CDS:2 [Entrophospora sp. SA101]|nr:13122_t:CDS:2 [Entrophospora sp. SA101]